ncbi:MAG: LysR family transcriptional regulator [Clostridiales bacterium]|nr:LysR family transcriptional regulator [Clostridiales bacterium]
MNSHQLQCFEAVYKEKSINKAARKLYMTPQGLGKTIQILEGELDTELFERTKLGVYPTESADYLHERAQAVIRQLDEISAAMGQFKNQKIILRIGYACGVFNVLPFRLILQFMQENPQIEVRWSEYPNVKVHELLLRCEIEYGFGIGLNREGGLVQHRLAHKAGYLLVYEGHPLYTAHSVHVGLLKNENIISLNEDFYIYHSFRYECYAQGFSPKIVAKTTDGTALYQLCRQKVGIAVIPEYNLQNLDLKNVRAICLENNLKLDIHGAYKRGNEKIPVIQMFDHYLKTYL